MYVPAYLTKHIFLKVRTDYIPNYSSLVSLYTPYFISNRIYLNICTKCFRNLLLEVKTDST